MEKYFVDVIGNEAYGCFTCDSSCICECDGQTCECDIK